MRFRGRNRFGLRSGDGGGGEGSLVRGREERGREKRGREKRSRGERSGRGGGSFVCCSVSFWC